MSQTSKIVLGIAVVAVLLAGAYYYWHMHQGTAAGSNSTAAADVTALPSGSSSTDASLAKDLASIDSQIQAVNKDNMTASASVAAAAQ
jgi:hypothetical protein